MSNDQPTTSRPSWTDMPSEDLAALRWAHQRLAEMGYEAEDGHEQRHPLDWWEAHPTHWAIALEDQANALVENWAEHATTLGTISTKLSAR